MSDNDHPPLMSRTPAPVTIAVARPGVTTSLFGYVASAFEMLSAGTTTLKVAVIEEKMGEVVDQAEIPVDVKGGFPTEATVKP